MTDSNDTEIPHYLKAAHQCCLFGRQYEAASTALAQKLPQLVFPCIVNAAFAIELYFKSLLWLENKKQPHGHKYNALFMALPPSVRDEIRAIVSAPLAGMPDSATRPEDQVLRQAYSIDEHIKRLEDPYTQLRYIHEGRLGSQSGGFAPAIYFRALKAVIAHRKPQWFD